MANSYNNKPYNKVDKFLQDVVYSVANIWGLGNEADDIINKVKGAFGRQENLNATQLIAYLKNSLGVKASELTKLINVVDSKLSLLPPALSQTMKQAIGAEKRKLISQRNKASMDLYKVEKALDTSTQLASQQDYLSSGRKEENQQEIQKLVGDVERSL